MSTNSDHTHNTSTNGYVDAQHAGRVAAAASDAAHAVVDDLKGLDAANVAHEAQDVHTPRQGQHSLSPAPSASALDAAATPATISGTKRKRASAVAASNRGVANLTPEQLERKRANDREAQRAIRERTKNHIDRLNREIEGLKSSQPYRELQAALRAKERVEDENRELKRRIAEFLGGVRVYLENGDGQGTGDGTGAEGDGGMVSAGSIMGQGGQGLNDLAAAAMNSNAPASELGQAGMMPYPPGHQLATPYGTIDSTSSVNSGQIVGSPASHSSSSRQYPYTGPNSWTAANGYDSSASNIQPDLQGSLPASDERLGLNYLLQQNHASRMIEVGATGGAERPLRQSHSTNQPWLNLPRNTTASCPLDNILLNFIDESNRLATDPNVTRAQLLGPEYPNFNAIIHKQTRHPSHPMSKLMTDILSTFPDLSNLPQKVAVVYIMFLVMKWWIDPTQERYNALPQWCRPTNGQLARPHPHWFDYLPWPQLREQACSETPFLPFADFFIPYTTTLTLNWPYDPQDVLIPRAIPHHEYGSHGMPLEEPKYQISPVFESHLRNLENWSLGEAFAKELPGWMPFVKVLEGSSNQK